MGSEEFNWPVRVYYEDTDSAGIVYHASFLRFMERARTEWLRSLGFDLPVLKNEHEVLFTVSRLRIDYLRPAKFNDMLDVSLSSHASAGRAFCSTRTYCARREIYFAGQKSELRA